MQQLKRLAQPEHVRLATHGRRQGIPHAVEQLIEMVLNDAPDDAVAQPFGRRVDGNDHPARGARVLGFLRAVREDHLLTRRHLAPVEVLDRTSNQQQLPRPDSAVEKRLARPGALDDA
jgi:hypothetical protein